MPNIQLANNLKYLRKKHNLTQTTLSQILNISRQAYSIYETSKRTPDLDSLLQLTTFYQVNLNDLVLGNLQDTTIYSDKVSETVVPYTFVKDKKTGNTIYLTDEELDLITQFRTLSKENKQIITGFLHSNSKNSV